MATKRTRSAKVPPQRSCGTMAVHMKLCERHPSLRINLERLEAATEHLRTMSFARAVPKVVTVKTVVHVVYKSAAQNISKAQIESQITALNKDFRGTNPDKSKVPAPWAGLVADTRIQFKLDQVTRTRTTVSAFSDDDGVKRAATGGIPPVSPKKRLNVWVCALDDGLLGYAQFPGGPTGTDGVVINYLAFGTKGTATSPFNKGRTTTHEVGHYFNLRHIWADTPGCSGSDMVADTPNCAGPNFGKPRWPKVSCSNGPNGDMFMNYMDYVDDAAMFLFTPGQVVRMRAALSGPRAGLAT